MGCCGSKSHQEILAQRNAQKGKQARYAGIPIVMWAKQQVANTFNKGSAKDARPKRLNTYQK